MNRIPLLHTNKKSGFSHGPPFPVPGEQALRHQIDVLQGNSGRPFLRWLDRAFWDVLCSIWPNWRKSFYIVQPETVVRWHRQEFSF
jgi:hypothetical protein